MNRQLYLAAYDVSDPKRLIQALHVLRGYATGGQKSVFECFLSESEHRALISEIEAVLDLVEDRFFLVRLDPRSKVRTLGIGLKPSDPSFYYIG